MAGIVRLLVAALGLAAASAQATFHLWTMNELYSSPDGTVQFLELTAITGGQQFMAGHELESRAGSNTHSFTFPSNLPGDSGGKRMLIGTASFAALGVVAPDYTVPDGFFFPGGGRINFAGADLWLHPALPANTDSLNRNGTTANNSPRNFAGQTGTVAAPAPLNFQALWYRAPAESESGWGVNITHQGDILFVTWFTYDLDGTGMWLVVPGARLTPGGTYTGDMFRTTGAPFSTNPWPSSSLAFSQVGSATFTFADANNGTFSYTVNGVSQSKPITRQIFDTRVPTCTANGTPGETPNYQDLWWNSPAESESGWGVNLTHQGDILFVTWFTYDATGRGLWLVGPATRLTAPGTYTGPLYRTTGAPFSTNPWPSSSLGFTEVGSVTFTFTSSNSGTFAYVVNGISQSKPITRQTFGIPLTVCR